MHVLSHDLGVSTFPWGCVTDIREKKSPFAILRPKNRWPTSYPGLGPRDHPKTRVMFDHAFPTRSKSSSIEILLRAKQNYRPMLWILRVYEAIRDTKTKTGLERSRMPGQMMTDTLLHPVGLR
ncbi:hypothetical protein CRG98_023132 [Punica granatum]|uniref:Uncharacterized protein n=1 Tax=Punica granatum TaxID=22663 RepID=A0A2I0JJP3_PUNGR|nr:hypothetical protein CRG98_023132 [Punica granatum]